jgi:hypothetical protein
MRHISNSNTVTVVVGNETFEVCGIRNVWRHHLPRGHTETHVLSRSGFRGSGLMADTAG